MLEKHRGRPTTDNPKAMRVDVRLTEELKMLDRYCQRVGVSRPQGLRDGIKALNAGKSRCFHSKVDTVDGYLYKGKPRGKRHLSI